jgi:hypothetical protein
MYPSIAPMEANGGGVDIASMVKIRRDKFI